MFYDRVKIYVRSGDGGAGMISFRREAHVPLGGPDGGDGGNGGDVILVGNPHMNSLTTTHKRIHNYAGNGVHGSTKKRHGKAGDPLRIEVPVGTLIRNADTDEILGDITQPGQEILLLSGGRGGRGNCRFTSSTNRAPRLAERGEPGQELWLLLELKLIADVGLVGKPNAGKSTLLTAVSDARPKVANYPFTTLTPSLGVATIDEYQTIVIADIPGLIEGASEGIGLGHEFLRHIERTRVLIHLLDGAAAEPLEDWANINQELKLYNADLEDRPQLVVLNKLDLPDAIAWEPIIQEEVEKAGYEFCAISAATSQGIRPMLYKVKQMLDDAPEPEPVVWSPPVITAVDDDSFTIEREEDGWRVHGKHIERIVAMTYFDVDTTLVRFQHILERTGISAALEKAGIHVGDTVYIGDETLEWGD